MVLLQNIIRFTWGMPGKLSSQKTATVIIMVLMSGNITQRGDFAILNKWERARLACPAGVDLVCELPFGYACQSADFCAWRD